MVKTELINLIRLRRYFPGLFAGAVACLMAILQSAALGQQKDNSLSFFEAAQMALSSDNNIQAANARLKASENDIDNARAAYYPRLALTGSYSHLSKTNAITLNLPGFQRSIKTNTENPADLNLALSGELYTFGRRPASVNMAMADNRSAQLRYNSTRKQIFDLTARSYVAAVFTGQNLRLLQDENQRISEIVNLVESRFKQGYVSEFDTLQTKFRLESNNSAVVEMTNNYSMAKINLAKLLNMADDKLPLLSDSLIENILLAPIPGKYQEAFSNREDYLDSQNLMEKAKSTKKLAQSSYFPSVALFTAYDFRNGYQPDMNKPEGSYSFGLNLNWLLFDGFGRRAQVRKSDYLIRAATFGLEDYKKTIPAQIKSQMLTLANNSSRVEIQNRALALAQKAMSIARKRYELGDLAMIELLDAENNLEDAELGLLKARYDYVMALLDVKKAAGYYPELDKIEQNPN
jgi:outer membrane protein